MAKQKLQIMRVELSQSAKAKLASLSDKKGMTQVNMMSRLADWFTRQDEILQGAVLGHYPPEIAPDIAAMILKKRG